MPNSPKLFKIGKEIVEARNMGEALGLKRAMQAEGKVSKGAVVVEHGPKDMPLGKVDVIEPKAEPLGKVSMAPAVAVPAISGSPMDALRDVGQAWQQHVVEPIGNALKSTLTPDMNVQGQTYQTASPASNMILETAADPINYVPGGAGAILGAGEAVAGFAEGGEVTLPAEPQAMPSVGIPLDQFEMADTQHAQGSTQLASAQPMGGGAIPIDQFESSEDAYGTGEQMGKTFAEGAAHGVLGPAAPLLEKHVLGVTDQDMLGRMKENPVTFGTGQAAGLGASMLTGVGEGALMAKAGNLAVEAAGLQGAKSLGLRVGSEAVRQAAEMAILQSSDEVSKMVMNDPDTSAESAIGHIGLSAALGGAGGAFLAGAVNPLWNATAGPAIDSVLGKLSGHLNGTKLVMPEATESAIQKLGIDMSPEMRAGISGDREAIEQFSRLKEAQHSAIAEGINKLHNDAAESVSRSLGVDPADISTYSKNEAGHDLLNSFKKEYSAKYEPLETAFNKRNAEAAALDVTDKARLDFYGNLLEEGMTKVGTDSPHYKLYKDLGERVLARDTVGRLDQLRTEIGKRIEGLKISDPNGERSILQDIRNSIGDFQESQIAKMGAEAGEGTVGREAGKAIAADSLNARAEINRQYKDFANMSKELSDNLGIGNKFSGAKSLENKLANNITPEQLLNKFTLKNNADFVPFLEKFFPETLQQVKSHELKELIKPAVLKAKGEMPIDVKKLADIVEKGMAGNKEYIETLLSPQAIESIQAAKTLMDAVPNPKSSGTAGWMTKMFDKMPASATAMIAMLEGHNPIVGGILGHTAQKLAIDAPNAVRLSYLKFLGSNQPIKAEGFKAMVDFVRAAAKGETNLVKATQAVFKAGAQVLPNTAINLTHDNEKLDKQVTKMQKDPSKMQALAEGQVGHYMPGHQTAIAASATRAITYLQSIKPQPHVLGPLDKPVPPQPSEIARYNRALSIANEPLTVLEHAKNGTIVPSDIQDLNSMYPALYKQMANKLSNEMISAHAKEQQIPYKTRIGVSLFLGTPVDQSMSPSSIMAAQPQPAGPQQGGQGPSKKGAPSNIGKKTTKMYMTPGQSAEADRSGRD